MDEAKSYQKHSEKPGQPTTSPQLRRHGTIQLILVGNICLTVPRRRTLITYSTVDRGGNKTGHKTAAGRKSGWTRRDLRREPQIRW